MSYRDTICNDLRVISINLKCILKQRQSLVYLSWKVTFAVSKVRHVPPFGYDHWTLLVFGVLGRFTTRELKFEDKYVEPEDMGYCTNINYTFQGQYNDYVLKTFCPDPVTQHKMAEKNKALMALSIQFLPVWFYVENNCMRWHCTKAWSY
jgi:hypothetical protein